MNLVEAVEQILPQTQCRQCGYGGCHPYALAIAEKNAPINLCIPGGVDGVEKLARLLNTPVIAFQDNRYLSPPTRAYIDESRCIGCTHCLRVCPIDAIVGSAKRMHTVLGSVCSGCKLCISICPVDCISMRPLTGAESKYEADLDDLAKQQRAQNYRWRFKSKQVRDSLRKQMRSRPGKVPEQKQIEPPEKNKTTGKVEDGRKDLLAQIMQKAQSVKHSEQHKQLHQQIQAEKLRQDQERARKREQSFTAMVNKKNQMSDEVI